MHAGVNLAFFKPDGRFFSVFFLTQNTQVHQEIKLTLTTRYSCTKTSLIWRGRGIHHSPTPHPTRLTSILTPGIIFQKYLLFSIMLNDFLALHR